MSDNVFGALTDVPGVLVGQAQRTGGGWLTGCTVVIPPPGTLGGVDVRGGGPATSETDALAPGTVTRRVDAVLLTGGSAYGLPAVAGVQRWCEEQGRGFPVGPGSGDVVPIVPALALFDLGRGGDGRLRPSAELAYEAASGAVGGEVATGNVGAGTGACLAAGALKGGIGTASVRLPGDVVVGALVAANAAGSPVDPVTGALLGRSAVSDSALSPRVPASAEPASSGARPPLNTTLVVVATDAVLDGAQATRLAAAAQAGLARALHPVQTLADGDAVVALATGTRSLDAAGEALAGPAVWPGAAARAGEVALQAATSTAVALAVVDAVLQARGVTTPGLRVASYLELYPSAAPPGWPIRDND